MNFLSDPIPLHLQAHFVSSLKISNLVFSFLLPPLQNGKISFEEFVCGLAILLHGSFSDKCKILFQVTYMVFYHTVKLALFPDCFSTHGGKNSLVNGLFHFVPCGFKDVVLRKAWNYERALRRQLIAGAILLWASKRKETKTYKLETSANLWVRETLRQSYLTFEAQNLHTEVIEFLRSLLRFQVPPSWLDWSSAQHFNRLTFFDCHLLQCVMSFLWSNLIEAPPMCHLEQKTNRVLTRLFFYLCAEN